MKPGIMKEEKRRGEEKIKGREYEFERRIRRLWFANSEERKEREEKRREGKRRKGGS